MIRPTDSPFIDDTEYPCDICGRMHDCEPCEHCSFSEANAEALRTILQSTEANDGERLHAARTLVRSGDWAADGVVAARVRDKLRRAFGRETVEALLDQPPAAADDEDLVQTFAELEADDGALSEVLFPAIAYRSRAVLAFGHRGQSKTSVCTWAARELSRAGLKVLVVGGDDPHTWRAALPRMGAFLQNVSYARAVDMAQPGILEKHVEGFDWVVVDNWRTWGLATDSAFDFNGDTAVGAAAGRLVALTDDDGPGVTIIANTGHHDESRSKGSAALEEAVHATRKVLLDGDLSVVEPAAKTREGIDRDTVTLRARLDAAGRPEAYWLESRGPGIPTPDPDGGTHPPKGWTEKHQAFLDAWRGEHPTGSGKACQRAFREAGLTVRNGTFWAEWKRSPVPGTDGTDGTDAAAEGGPTVPDPRRGPGDRPVAGGIGAVPDVDQGPALREGAGVDLGGGSDMDMNADTQRANALNGLDGIPDWESRATALGLTADILEWTEEDWRAVLRACGETWVPAPVVLQWTAPDGTRHVVNVEALKRQPEAFRRHSLARLPDALRSKLATDHGVAA